ncbi:hypothetical protein [Streptomyces lunaelactis]|uniref:hypothetical protein n=1 Tax=Streptomyces lunaelactis TaxID=1535768 RepID=UPI0015848089|nr:hypothetical protein [Streptomyces lunaelactis]NUL14486.1 hypothetical protein [Streptomyces lunaelactis]
MQDYPKPEQPPSGPLNASLRPEPPALGPSRRPQGVSGPQAGAQPLDAAARRHALAFNAVGPALNERGEWLPLSVRKAVADAVLAAIDNPPGSTREQLPADVLALLSTRSYLSTACDTGRLLEGAAIAHPDRATELRTWRDRMHQRCRLAHKFTGQPCTCPCHPTQPAAPAEPRPAEEPS